jgi:hypothetical protein
VEKLELERGGELVYTMTASGPEQVEFMRNAGLPLTSTSRKRFTEVDRPRRLAYMSLVDFVPDAPPSEFLTVVELEPANGDVQVSMTVNSMHEQVWTERSSLGARTNSTASPHSSRAVADGGDDFSERTRS